MELVELLADHVVVGVRREDELLYGDLLTISLLAYASNAITRRRREVVKRETHQD